MIDWKRAMAGLLAAALLSGALAGCGQSGGETGSGWEMTVCLGGAPATLDPIQATEDRDLTVLNHLYENLMKVTSDGAGGVVVATGMARSYDIDENNDGSVTYTFHLRSSRWSDGEAVTAQDFVYAWQRLANPASQSPSAPLLAVVKGYDQVQSTGDVTALAVEARNESTFAVTLTGACPWFLTDVCTSPATVPLREDVVQDLKAQALALNETIIASGGVATATWSSDYTKLVTNGPYAVESSNSETLVLRRSGEYASSVTSGPDTLTFRYAATAGDAWGLYESGAADLAAPLPEEELALLAQDGTQRPIPELSTYTLLFNTAADPFTISQVRQAFSLTLDRTALAETAGVAATAATGLVPTGVPGSEDGDFRADGGALISVDQETYADDCAQAEALLDEAGFGSGYRLPAMDCLYVDEGANGAVVSAMAAMWSSELGVAVTPTAVTEEALAAALAAGDFTLAAVDLAGYANDAESFLAPWVSDGRQNTVSYSNSAYDTLLSVIKNANDETARLGCLHDAEVLLLEDCPLVPLLFTSTGYAVRDGLAGICRDSRGFFSFATAAQLS